MTQLTVTGSAVGTLRARRLAAGLSQERLAHAAACSVAMVKLLESGFSPKRSAVLARILTALTDAENEVSPAIRPGSREGP